MSSGFICTVACRGFFPFQTECCSSLWVACTPFPASSVDGHVGALTPWLLGMKVQSCESDFQFFPVCTQKRSRYCPAPTCVCVHRHTCMCEFGCDSTRVVVLLVSGSSQPACELWVPPCFPVTGIMGVPRRPAFTWVLTVACVVFPMAPAP